MKKGVGFRVMWGVGILDVGFKVKGVGLCGF